MTKINKQQLEPIERWIEKWGTCLDWEARAELMKAVRKDLTVSYQDQLALQELKTDAQVALIKIQNLLASEKDNRQEV